MKEVVKRSYRIPLAYFIMGSVWIAFSDSLVANSSLHIDNQTASTAKGLAFMAVTSLLLFLSFLRQNKSTRIAHLKEIRTLRRLNSLESDYFESINDHKTIFDNTAVGIAYFKNYTIVRVNHKFGEIFGMSDLIGKNCYDLMKCSNPCSNHGSTLKPCEYAYLFDGNAHSAEVSLGNLWVQFDVTPVKDGNVVVICQDVTQRKIAEHNIHHLAYYDFLTGLPNRVLMMDRLKQSLEKSSRTNERVGLMFIDLDDFKLVNDTYGHQVGDELLKMVSERISSTLRCYDTVARMGGDEFVVIIDGTASDMTMAVIARKINESLSEPFHLSNCDVFVTTSIGIAMAPDDGDSPDDLLKYADIAMYKAKESGRNQFKFFNPRMNVKNEDRMFIETHLRYALERSEFHLEYQPFYDLVHKRISGLEALCRWNHPTEGNIPPVKFIPVAEENGLIIRLGEWILNQACVDAKRLHDHGIHDVKIAVNVSGKQMKHYDVVNMVKRTLQTTGIDPWAVELELTESSIMENVEESMKVLNDFIQLGVKIAVDDFGTGYSSLSYLKHFPVDKLKIDKSFVDGLPHNEHDSSIVKIIVSLADTMDLNSIGEGVETWEQFDFLREAGVKEAQGYLIGKPMTFDTAKKFILEFNPTKFEARR